ncbi:MAG: hypothetical protein NVSMB9_07390 [Isosphaeraceae bacterium]
MDRRSFVPSAEGLEGRALLSSLGARGAARNYYLSIQNLPETFRQKETRIQNLPTVLRRDQPGRFLPERVTLPLQQDLRAIAGNLHAPSTPVVVAFNKGLRHAFPHKSLSAENAHLLNASFGSVLQRAGATPIQANNLQRDMNEIAKIDSQSIDPSRLARDDYALVLQTALSVGRPLRSPPSPALSPRDHAKGQGGNILLTHNRNPTLVGTYPMGLTKDGVTIIQVVDDRGEILGSRPLDRTGRYSLKLSQPLDDGLHTLYARVTDPEGHLSQLSRPLTLKVQGPPVRSLSITEKFQIPGGPLAHRGKHL